MEIFQEVSINYRYQIVLLGDKYEEKRGADISYENRNGL